MNRFIFYWVCYSLFTCARYSGFNFLYSITFLSESPMNPFFTNSSHVILCIKEKNRRKTCYVSINHTHTNYSLFDCSYDLFKASRSLKLALLFSWWNVVFLVIKCVLVVDNAKHQIIWFFGDTCLVETHIYSLVLKSICIWCIWSIIFCK